MILNPKAGTPAKVICLGMGQQSVTVYLMSCAGEIPRADVAVFADPGAEKRKTNTYVDYLLQWAKENKGIPIVIAGRRNILTDLTSKEGSRFASIPMYTRNEDGSSGILRRQCTKEYKIDQINQALRAMYGLQFRQKMPPTELFYGISLDEMERMRQPDVKWQTNYYPLIGYRTTKASVEKANQSIRYTRNDCVQWLKRHGFLVPPKSACFFCPFQNNLQWLDLKQNDPVEWQQAVALDYLLRDSTKAGVNRPAYLHRSCQPLDKAPLHEEQLSLFNFNAECYGHCGV